MLHGLLAVAGVLGVAEATTSDAVADCLSQLTFLNSGTVHRNDSFSLASIASIYNEGYTYFGSGHTDWSSLAHVGWTGLDYLVQNPPGASSASTCSHTVVGSNIDLKGHDLDAIAPRLANATVDGCAAICCATEGCTAFLFEPLSAVDFFQCKKGFPCCFLKSGDPKSGPLPPGSNVSSVAAFIIKSPPQTLKTPPSGMRSSVPLGPLGEGSVELRADGRLADWGTILNNGPYAPDPTAARKVEFDDAAFAVWSPRCGATLVRTQLGPNQTDTEGAPSSLPLAESLTYAGAFPTARLTIDTGCADRGTTARLDAFSQFEAHPAAGHAPVAPIVYFTFTISNAGTSATDAAVLFSVPNVTSGVWGATADKKGLTFSSEATEGLRAGTLTLAVVDAPAGATVTAAAGSSLADNVAAFGADGGMLPTAGGRGAATDGAVAAKVTVPAGSAVTVTLAMAWYFPNRLWGTTNLGHMYENFFSSSEDVVAKEGTPDRVVQTLDSALAWHAVCLHNNSFDAGLQDSLVNTPAAWGKTSFFTKDGRWRNFESHSCAQMEPPHIHFYRALGYMLFLPAVERQTPALYTKVITPGGLLGEIFGCGCGGCAGRPDDLDHNSSNSPRGDDDPVYILDVYMNWKWGADGGAFLASIWPGVKAALNFTIAHAQPHGLTFQMVNTNDEHGIIGDINTYNAQLYLTGLAAGAAMAAEVGDTAVEAACTRALAVGRAALDTLLWTDTGGGTGHYQQTWCKSNITTGNALQAGVLYGSLWAHVLGLEDAVGVPPTRLAAHLREERTRNKSPYGLFFTSNRTANVYGGCKPGPTAAVGINTDSPLRRKAGVIGARTGFVDQDVWNSHSMTHAALSLYTQTGSRADALAVAASVIEAYRTTMADQWDYRDTTTTYDDATATWDPAGVPRPSVNSHYGRQTIWWSIPLALTGQRFDATRNALDLRAHPELGPQWPLVLPCGAAHATERRGGCVELARITGSCDYTGLALSRHGRPFTLLEHTGAGGGRVTFCPT